MMNVESKKKGDKPLKSTIRPLLMVAFVIVMVILMQHKLAENQKLKEQQKQVDPSSIIYSDVGKDNSAAENKVETSQDDAQAQTTAKKTIRK